MVRRTILAVLAVLLLALLLLSRWMAPERPPATYYVSPGGNDQNSGSLESPWQSIGHALGELRPGDVLHLRGGVYYESGIEIALQGVATAPITIQAYPGERPIIDGGVPYYREAPNDEWELVDGDTGLYRSRRRFPDHEGFVGGWLLDDDIQLVAYDAAANLESSRYDPINGMEPVYVGPGLQLREDGHIYIRLAPNPHDLTDAQGNAMTPVPVDPDPNHNRLAIFFAGTLFRLDGARYLQLKNVEMAHAAYLMDVRSGSHITLSGCRMRYGNRGLVLRENVHALEIDRCEFTNGLPPHVYWTDVKNRDQEVGEAYPEFQSAAIAGSLSGSHIHDSVFRDVFDGITLEDGTTDTRITDNVFVNSGDDAINLSRGISNVEVAHNLLWQVMGGIANLGSEEQPGHVYIHHNVIDNAAYRRGGRPGNYREDNWPVWTIGSPFPDHDQGNKTSWWKVYNNTIVTRQDNGHRWAAAGPDNVTGNPEKYVLNNIFYVLGERVVFRNEHAATGSHYDGNVFYRDGAADLPLFTDFGDGGRYNTLADFRAGSGTPWERQGLETDPGFVFSAGLNPLDDPAAFLAQYRPATQPATSPGVGYEGLAWPGVENVNYRGAVPPVPAPTTLLPERQVEFAQFP
jgi:hypothetical protein